MSTGREVGEEGFGKPPVSGRVKSVGVVTTCDGSGKREPGGAIV